jgi:hypothetical protein
MSAPRPVAARQVPAARGFAWLSQAFLLLRAQTARLLLLALVMQLILGLSQVPLLGLLIVLSVPGLTAGLLEAFHRTSHGGRPSLGVLFAPLTSGAHAGRLLAMGALVFAVGVVCVSAMLAGSTEWADPAMLERIEQGDIEAMAGLGQESLGRMALAFLIGIAVSGTLSYFTVPLIWFRDRKLLDSLGTGLKALLVNWRPFLALGLGLLLLFLPVAILSGLLFALVRSGGLASAVVMGLIMVLLLLFQMMLFGTQYCAFRDIFGIPSQAVAAPEDDGQLVA